MRLKRQGKQRHNCEIYIEGNPIFAVSREATKDKCTTLHRFKDQNKRSNVDSVICQTVGSHCMMRRIKMSRMKKTKNHTVNRTSEQEQARINYVVNNIKENKAFVFNRKKDDDEHNNILAESLIERYTLYRDNWKNQPEVYVSKINKQEKDRYPNLLCLDIEVAAICDLACPFCYRQFEATPDKIMKDDLAYKLIDQAAEMNCPSIKFNWRGEPLMNPNLPKFIKYAKQRGIIETIINTNATRLTKEMSEAIIEAGIDLVIFSFDGGKKETYEKMRPGRFAKNDFETVVNNIIQFAKLKKMHKATFPLTRIQCIETAENREEVLLFKKIFDGFVDEIVTKQYTERGGGIKELNLNELEEERLSDYPKNSQLMRKLDGSLYVGVKRLPCDQPFQRMLVTYDGRVGMCCYDWGAKHTVGYCSSHAFTKGIDDLNKTLENAKESKKGFEKLKDIKRPRQYNEPKKVISKIKDIWEGDEIQKVRSTHSCGKVNEIEICSTCPFKVTHF